MDLGLKGRRVLVSGGSRGIGLAIARQFLDEGASVAFFARGQDGVDAALEDLAKHGTVFGDALDAGNQGAFVGGNEGLRVGLSVGDFEGD